MHNTYTQACVIPSLPILYTPYELGQHGSYDITLTNDKINTCIMALPMWNGT